MDARRVRIVAVVCASLLGSSVTAQASVWDKPVLDEITALQASDLTPYQWGLQTSGALAAHSAGLRGEGVTVAVLDSGVDGTHPDLAGQLLPGWYYKNGEKITFTDISAMNDTDGHGTHVSGLIAASDNGTGVTGMAPGAKILPVRVFEPDEVEGGEKFSFESAEGFAQALFDAADAGARVINLSLGETFETYDSEIGPSALCDAVTELRSQGVLTVVAAGNSGSRFDFFTLISGVNNPMSSPAACEDAVTVAALQPNGTLADFSSFDDTVDIAAAGDRVLSSVPSQRYLGDLTGFMEEAGTSMAAPQVAGAIAVLMGAYPSASVDEIEEMLYGAALDLGSSGPDSLYGHGMLNLAGALGLEGFNPVATPRPYIDGVKYTSSYKSAADAALLSWTPPVSGAAVTGMRIEAVNPDGTRLTKTYSSREVRGYIGGVGPGTVLRVVALTASGEESSYPYVIGYAAPEVGAVDIFDGTQELRDGSLYVHAMIDISAMVVDEYSAVYTAVMSRKDEDLFVPVMVEYDDLVGKTAIDVEFAALSDSYVFDDLYIGAIGLLFDPVGNVYSGNDVYADLDALHQLTLPSEVKRTKPKTKAKTVTVKITTGVTPQSAVNRCLMDGCAGKKVTFVVDGKKHTAKMTESLGYYSATVTVKLTKKQLKRKSLSVRASGPYGFTSKPDWKVLLR